MSAPRRAPSSLHRLLHQPASSSASRLVRSPTSVRRVAAALGLLLLLLGPLLLLVPWQQAALGTGRVIAFSMEQRQQTIDAPVSGVVESWQVREGDRVAKGDVLVVLRDNDPGLLDRLVQTLEMGRSQVEMLEQQIISYRGKALAEEAARELKVAEASSKVLGLQRKMVGMSAAVEVEALQAERQGILAREGIASTRAAEVARMKAAKSTAVATAMEAEIQAARHARDRARANGDAKVAAAQADLEAARAKHSSLQQKQLQLEVKLQRQHAQRVLAPRDGAILSLSGGPGGTQIKKGDRLVTLVPETDERAVEIWIDGNDMPLVREGEQVRLIFEGWPALQMVGFPGADAGTYVGQVAFVNATDDGKGNFRVVVVPDPAAHAWPTSERLRQGVRAKGWILLGQVSLGYELWRRINGFPSLPPIEKGNKPLLPSSKKSKAPASLK